MKLLFLLIAGVVVAFGVIYLRGRAAPEEMPPEIVKAAPIGVRVLTVRRDVPLGSIVQASDLDWLVMAPDQIKGEYLKDGEIRITDFGGSVARRSLKAGDALTQGALLKAGEGGVMSAVLGAGMRAVSVSVNPISGNAGFVLPGDRVDLILTHRIRASAEDSESIVSETFIHNVKVIAVDQSLENAENKPILAKTVTVEVTPTQAEQLSVATEMGKVSISLRSIGGAALVTDTIDPAAASGDVPAVVQTVPVTPTAPVITDLYTNYTRDRDVSRFLGTETPSQRVRVIRGDKTEDVEVQ
ncbi:MAG: Flp pilus assembly protein CpaB [Rickettsiales bacterium]|nr:Flp pilus assembly protein CpaB [Rickettsiales bacterium]